MKKIALIFSYLLISCNTKTDKKIEQIRSSSKDVSFDIENVDTLDSGPNNVKLFKYSNKAYENKENRYVEVIYVIGDSLFDGDVKKVEQFDRGGVSDVRTYQDTLRINTFANKGDKFITIVVYDEIRIPVTKDSVNVKSVTNLFGYKTFIK